MILSVLSQLEMLHLMRCCHLNTAFHTVRLKNRSINEMHQSRHRTPFFPSRSVVSVWDVRCRLPHILADALPDYQTHRVSSGFVGESDACKCAHRGNRILNPAMKAMATCRLSGWLSLSSLSKWWVSGVLASSWVCDSDGLPDDLRPVRRWSEPAVSHFEGRAKLPILGFSLLYLMH